MPRGDFWAVVAADRMRQAAFEDGPLQRPRGIVIDHGTEFTSKVLDQWAYENHVTLHFITPGRPMENGYVESFHGKFRGQVPRGVVERALAPDAR